MKVRWKRLLVGIAGVGLTLLVAACGSGGGGGGSKGARLDLVIGDSLPLTGELAALGPSGQKASDLAIDQINSAIGDSGADHSVNVVHEDNATDPATAEDIARKMIQRDGASCLTGAWATEDTLETAQSVAVPTGTLEITPASSGDQITQLDDQGLLDQVVPSPKDEGETLAKAIDQDLGGADGKTVNVAARSDTYGDDYSQAFIDAWQNLGGTVGGLTIYSTEPAPTSSDSSTGETTTSDFSSTDQSFSSEASQITDGDPDAYVVADYADSFAKVVPSLDATGVWDPEQTWGTDGLAVPMSDQDALDSVEGLRAIVPGTPKDADASSAFDDLFKSGDPKDVPQSRYAAQQFDATILCYLAAVAAGSIDGQKMADALIDITAPGGDEFTWQELPDAIDALQNGDDIDYTGASGPVNLNIDGDATAGVYDVYQYTDGALDLSGELPVPEPKPSP